MTSRDQGLQNWNGGPFYVIKLIGLNSRFAKICIKAQEQKWPIFFCQIVQFFSHFCSCAFMQIFANLEFIPINFIVFKVPPVQFWSPWCLWFTYSWGLSFTVISSSKKLLWKKYWCGIYSFSYYLHCVRRLSWSATHVATLVSVHSLVLRKSCVSENIILLLI